LWEAERRIVLDQRIQKAKADKAQALQTAAGEISNFYKQREEKLNKTKTTNRYVQLLSHIFGQVCV